MVKVGLLAYSIYLRSLTSRAPFTTSKIAALVVAVAACSSGGQTGADDAARPDGGSDRVGHDDGAAPVGNDVRVGGQATDGPVIDGGDARAGADGSAADGAPNGGDARAGDAAPADGAAPGRPGSDGGSLSFAVAVLPILVANCTRCHDPSRPLVPETTTYVQMDLTPGGAYAALVGKPATEACGGTLVTRGDPAASYLYHKVADTNVCFGSSMPARGALATRPQLPAADVATIAAWILDGASP